MKRFLLYLILLSVATQLMAGCLISGIVVDGHREPIVGANVFVYGTVDGCATDSLGRFGFRTDRDSTVIVMVTFLGYEDKKISVTAERSTGLRIILYEKTATIDEVVVSASSYNFGTGDNVGKLGALDVVMQGSSNGDIYAALQSLPGTQRVGESGRLYVRGGESSESQTYINGMHVLNPYATNAGNSPVRGRFSPFLFKGISFSLGGYGGEYGQALSSVLLMETTDVATGDKLGFSVAPIELNFGGTKAFRSSSWSFNSMYDDMGLYNAVFPSSVSWKRPYRRLSGETQYKAELSPSNVLKTYVGYDLTNVGQHLAERDLSLREHNIYINTVYKAALGRGCSVFAGAANSLVFNRINGARKAGDVYEHDQNEVHLKATFSKTFGNSFRLLTGTEDYIRRFRILYRDSLQNSSERISHYQIISVFAEGQLRLSRNWFVNLSERTEYFTCDRRWRWMPRLSVNYITRRGLHFALMYGRYCQSADDEYILRSGKKLGQSVADHFIASLQWRTYKTIIRVEPYYKRYRHLPLSTADGYAADGHGMSRGIDFFLEDMSVLPQLRTMLSYSYNDSRRRYLNYLTSVCPHYATRHNLSISATYGIDRLKTYIGVSENITSGRPYTDPRLPGAMNARTKPYQSLGINASVLVSPKVIVYASVINLLNHKNVFGYTYSAGGTRREPVTIAYNRMFFIGIFVSLKHTKAYEIANF